MAGWYVRRGEKLIGPIEVDKLQESVAAGKLLPTDQLAKNAAGPWTEAGKTELFTEPKLQAIEAVRQAERLPEQGGLPSKRVLSAVGLVVILVVVAVAAFLIRSRGEPGSVAAKSSDSEPRPAEPVAPKPTTERPAPFEYKILSEEWHRAFVGKAVTVKAQVADNVAPTVTKADLESLVPVFMEKYNGQPFGIYFYTETPLVQAWGVISYMPQNTVGEKLRCDIHQFAFEMGPWYFPDRIDPKTKWHELVWLTLPKVNKIVNGATQYHWKVTSRSANDVYFDSKQSPLGAMKDKMNLDPQTWEISTYDGDVPRFVRLVESSLNYLDDEFSQKVVGKLNSVIGSQDYLNGDKAYWTWMIDRLEVTYLHHGGDDTITIMQTKP